MPVTKNQMPNFFVLIFVVFANQKNKVFFELSQQKLLLISLRFVIWFLVTMKETKYVFKISMILKLHNISFCRVANKSNGKSFALS